MTPAMRTWIAALRSGEYIQGRRCMRHAVTGRYCCLGVAEKAIWGTEFISLIPGNPNRQGVLVNGHVEFSALPPEHLRELGVTCDDVASLVNMNDDRKLTFEQIADALERAVLEGISVEQASRPSDPLSVVIQREGAARRTPTALNIQFIEDVYDLTNATLPSSLAWLIGETRFGEGGVDTEQQLAREVLDTETFLNGEGYEVIWDDGYIIYRQGESKEQEQPNV